MHSVKRKPVAVVVLVALALLLSATVASAGDRGEATYELSITNMTNGQPISPPVVVVHRRPTSIFHVGQAATIGIQEVAENGNNGPLLAALARDKHAHDVQQGDVPLVPSGTPGAAMFPDNATFTLSSAMGAKYLSLAAMLICTNDGFTGIDSLRLPHRVGQSVTVYTQGYDAGTEINTEDFADIVPPCQGLIGISSADPGTGMSNPALAENGVITHHSGIMGGDDLLPAVHGWTNPVASVTITRTN